MQVPGHSGRGSGFSVVVLRVVVVVVVAVVPLVGGGVRRSYCGGCGRYICGGRVGLGWLR